MNKPIKNNYLKKIISIIITGLIVIATIIGIILFSSQKKDNFDNNQNNILENNNDNNQIKDNESSNNIVKKETKSKKLSLKTILLLLSLLFLLLLLLFIVIFIFRNIGKVFFYFTFSNDNNNCECLFKKINNLSDLFKYFKKLMFKKRMLNQFYDAKIKIIEKEKKSYNHEKQEQLEIFIKILKELKKDSYLSKIINDYTRNTFDAVFNNKKYKEVIDLYYEYCKESIKNENIVEEIYNKIVYIEKDKSEPIWDNYIFCRPCGYCQYINFFISKKKYFQKFNELKENGIITIKNNKININIYKYLHFFLDFIDNKQEMDNKQIIIPVDNGLENLLIGYSFANYLYLYLKIFLYDQIFNKEHQKFLSKQKKIFAFLNKLQSYSEEMIDKLNQMEIEKDKLME